ncbi:MAG TPA: STAS/SEC14 domain-containing protein [Nitrospiria bacterium]|nr:STAS/SEC14 domain-containing protein [Nitrospiria bacterium]
MIELIQGLPPHVLGFRATGTVTEADYKTAVIPAVDAMLATHTTVRVLYYLGEEFSGFDAAAMWEDAKVGFMHLSAWERIAVVTDVEWIRAAMKVFGFLLPGRIRLFQNTEFQAARAWVSA